VRFLIDECLTVELTREAERAGYEAHHVAHLGKASWKDWAIRDYAVNGDFILVTNNASDFRRLYAATDVHPGLVILVPNVVQETQVVLFREAIKRLAQSDDTVNKVLEVDISEEDIILKVYDFPAAKRSR
jgi:predicted nuclease of predicted toxin-antitoxin system